MNLITPNTAKFQEELEQLSKNAKTWQCVANEEKTRAMKAAKESDSCITRTTDRSLLNNMIGWICSLFLGQLILIYFLMRMFHK